MRLFGTKWKLAQNYCSLRSNVNNMTTKLQVALICIQIVATAQSIKMLSDDDSLIQQQLKAEEFKFILQKLAAERNYEGILISSLSDRPTKDQCIFEELFWVYERPISFVGDFCSNDYSTSFNSEVLILMCPNGQMKFELFESVDLLRSSAICFISKRRIFKKDTNW